jgi:hypothetical protein
MRLEPKALLLRLLFGRWQPRRTFEEGYSIILAMPMDMPFLLRYALEGIATLDTTHCRQIIVIPDGWGSDGGKGMREVVAASADPRVELVELSPTARFFIHKMGKSVGTAANSCHWAMIVQGLAATRCEYGFLHDADAFFVDADAIERQYRECRDKKMSTLGVTARWDPFFLDRGYAIPATWELMVSTRWARTYNPVDFKGRWRDSPDGRYEFDNALFPEYMDYATGKIGLIEPPPRIVHFNGAITTYRIFRYEPHRPVVDEVFRLLLLSLLEELIPAGNGEEPAVPRVADLARGLDDPSAAVSYDSDTAAREYPTFRAQVEEMCQAPIFQGPRADKIRELIAPFDHYFEKRTPIPLTEEPAIKYRRHGLG